MPYRFALERSDYSDLAGGKVLLGAPGHPAFPVRLASEVFQRCVSARFPSGPAGQAVVYDPCCGTAYHLAVLGFLHRESIAKLLASDVDPDIIPLAEKNLAMLSPAGLARRQTELEDLGRRFGKESHREALAASKRLSRALGPSPSPLEVQVFRADILTGSRENGIPDATADIVLADVPYGRHARWQIPSAEKRDPLWLLMENLRQTLSSGGVLAVASDKGQRARHELYERVEHFQIGKRTISIWKLKT